MVLRCGELCERSGKLDVLLVAAKVGGKRVDALQPHRLVGESEGFLGVRVSQQYVDASAQARRHRSCLGERHRRGVLVPRQPRRGVVEPRLLLVEPLLVGVGERRETGAERVASETGEHLHVEHDL